MGRIIAGNKHTGKLYPVDSKAIYRVIYEVVDVLPTENIKTSVIYCIPIVGKENEYDMFLYIDSDWVSVGSGSIDLSDYYTKEETAELLSDKMDLAPLNPTAQEIKAMPSGQLYSDTANHKGVIKGGQEFYDTTVAVRVFENNNGQSPPLRTVSDYAEYHMGDIWINLSYQSGERVCTALYICKSIWTPRNFVWQYRWLCLYGTNSEYYTKTEINQKGYLTLETLPIYDGTVI